MSMAGEHTAPTTEGKPTGANKPLCPRLGKRFRAWNLQGPYDALVIGSGMGGLTTAALLSDMGWKVAVLEQHYTAGGYTHSYERKGYEWDVGLHYVGEMAPGHLHRKVMDFITGGRLDWASMGQMYDRVFIGTQSYDIKAGEQAFRSELLRRFPDEAPAIDGYIAAIKKVKRALPPFFAGRVLRSWQLALAQPVLKWLQPGTATMTTQEVLNGLTSNRDLLAVLSAFWGDYGLPPDQSSFMIHAIVASHYLEGGYYPVGGSWRIAEAVLPKIRAAGGEVFTYARVKQIIVEQGKTKGVLMEDGTRIDCACVVSTAGVSNTFEHLVPDAEVKRAGYARQMPSVKPSSAHLGLYVGLRQTAEQLGLPKHNLWIHPSADLEGNARRFFHDPTEPFPVVYVSFPSAKDPAFNQRYPGKATIEMVVPVDYDWFAKWKDTIWGKRGDDYETFKAQWGDRLLAALYDKLPQLRGQIDYVEVSTPLSTNWFNAYQYGEMYGLGHEPDRFKQDWLRPRTPIEGLWLSGQDVLSCGVVGAMMSGVLTTAAMVGMGRMGPVLWRILRKRSHRVALGNTASA